MTDSNLEELVAHAAAVGLQVEECDEHDSPALTLRDQYGSLGYCLLGPSVEGIAREWSRRILHLAPTVEKHYRRACGAPTAMGWPCREIRVGNDGLCTTHRRKLEAGSPAHVTWAELKALELAPVLEREPA